MYEFAAAQQTSTAKLPAFFKRFQTEERVLRVNLAIFAIKIFEFQFSVFFLHFTH